MPEGTLKQYWPKVSFMVCHSLAQHVSSLLDRNEEDGDAAQDSDPYLFTAELYLACLQDADAKRAAEKAKRKRRKTAGSNATADEAEASKLSEHGHASFACKLAYLCE